MKTDVYQTVTNKIIASLEQGVRPWSKPWSAADTGAGFVLPLRGNGVPYRGINVLMLWGASPSINGYRLPDMVHLQAGGRRWAGRSGRARKGSTCRLRLDHDPQRNQRDDRRGERAEHIPFLKGYTVFNVAQIDGLPERPIHVSLPLHPCQRQNSNGSNSAERFVSKATGATVRHGGVRAFYQHRRLMPCRCRPLEAFRDRGKPITAPSSTS